MSPRRAHRIVLFSGGVESTLMAQASEEGDLLLTIRPPFAEYFSGINPKAGDIARLYEREHQQMDSWILPELPSRVRFVHQIWWLGLTAELLTRRYPDYDMIWYGGYTRSMEDVAVKVKHSVRTGEVDKQWRDFHWEHPGLVTTPYRHLTKAEQWSLIDPKVRPLVSPCLKGFRCGECWKCDEFQTVTGEEWVLTKEKADAPPEQSASYQDQTKDTASA